MVILLRRSSIGVPLQHFSEWAGEQLPGEISAFEIEGFIGQWATDFETRHGREPSPDTKSNLVTAIRAFYAFMDKHDLLTDRNGVSVKNPCTKLDPIRVRRRVKEWLSQDELDRLVNAARTPEQAFLIRWYALTGARAREGSHVRLADVDLSGNGRILIPGSKTDAAVRPVPVHRELRPHLELRVLRMQAAGMESSTPILHTRNRRSITEQQAHRWVREVAERAHLGKRVNPADATPDVRQHFDQPGHAAGGCLKAPWA